MNTINRTQAETLLRSLKNGTIYSVTFIKKDGSVRLLNSVKGTRKGVKGVGLKFDPEPKGLIPVYDIQLKKAGNPEDKCWRMVNVNTLQEVKVNNEAYTVVD